MRGAASNPQRVEASAVGGAKDASGTGRGCCLDTRGAVRNECDRPPVTRMLEHEAGADTRLVRPIDAGMKIQAGGEHMGCSKVGENQENQVIRLQRQDEVVRVGPGSPRSPRRATATRLSSGSAGKGNALQHVGASSGPSPCDMCPLVRSIASPARLATHPGFGLK